MSILVATDFSPCSAGAVRLATALARRRAVPLVIVHAVEPVRVGDPMLPMIPAGWHTGLLNAAEEALAREAAGIRETGVAVETRVLVGAPAATILDLARGHEADLIVVGTHGRKGGAHLFLGSVAETVVRSSTCPVVVVRDGAADTRAWEGRAPLHLAVALDGSGASQSALSWAGQFAEGSSCDLALMRFYVPFEESVRYGFDDPWDAPLREAELLSLVERDLRRDAQALLGNVPERIRFRAIAHEASDALKEESTTLGADAVVIGVPRHRWSRWTAVAAGPILRSSRLPVVCVPEAAGVARHSATPVRSILIASDLSDASRDLVAPAYGLLQAQGGRVELCTVREVGIAKAVTAFPVAPPLTNDERAALEARLRALVPEDASRAGITTNVSVIEGEAPAECILAAAERLDVDLIAVGSHGRSGFKRAVLGSVAEEVARNSTRPVLLVRGRTARARP